MLPRCKIFLFSFETHVTTSFGFGWKHNTSSFSAEPEKDDFERKLLHAFIAEGKPVFGICRGFQLIIREWLNSHEAQISADYDKLVFYQNISNHSLVETRNVSRSTPTHYVFTNGHLHGEN